MLHARLVTPDILPPRLRLDRDPGLDSGELDVMASVLMPACPTIRIGSQHSGATGTRNIPLVGLL